MHVFITANGANTCAVGSNHLLLSIKFTRIKQVHKTNNFMGLLMSY